MSNEKQYFSGLALVLFMAVLTLVSCGSNEVARPGSENANEGSSGTGGAESAVSESPTLAVNDLPDSTDNASGSGGAPELGFALGEPNLKATDPGTVSLASGKIQLIEFFAYW